MKALMVYDCEIIKAICGKDDERITGIEYCEGWRDFTNMGISVIGAYDYDERRYRVFLKDNFNEFQQLVTERQPIGFNSIAFDDKLCAANDIKVSSWDLLAEMWEADGLEREFVYPSHVGYGLDATAAQNGLQRKSGHGAKAPVQWQRGEYGSVIDYCIQDVKLTKELVDLVLTRGWLRNPSGGDRLRIKRP